MKLAPFVALTLACGAAAARDVGQIPENSDPKISTWFRTAKSPSGTACCNEADGYREGVRVRVVGGEPTVIFRSWWAASDGGQGSSASMRRECWRIPRPPPRSD
jgi:hypothetical protein